MATFGHERPTTHERLMEEICDPANLKRALKRVKANKGSPGVDGMTVEKLPAFVWKHWGSLCEDLLQGPVQPRPVKWTRDTQARWRNAQSRHSVRFGPFRSTGGAASLTTPIGIPNVLRTQPRFSPKPLSPHDAVAQAQQYIAEGYNVVVDLDVEKFSTKSIRTCSWAAWPSGSKTRSLQAHSQVSQCGSARGWTRESGDRRNAPGRPSVSSIVESLPHSRLR